MIRVGYYQFRPIFGKVAHNRKKVIQTLRNISADLIVLPELAFTGYYFRDREEVKLLAEDLKNSPTVDVLKSLCHQKNFYIVTGFAEKYLDKYFNSALLIGPEGLLQSYRKLHLFYKEKEWFDRSEQELQVTEIRGIKIGMMVCFDWFFPEVMRILTLKKADIICHPSNLVLPFCQDAMITRCLENNVFAITANRFGWDKRSHGNLHFTGKSQIVGPNGNIINRSCSQREVIYITEIDSKLAREKNITPVNELFSDRRTDLYFPLCE